MAPNGATCRQKALVGICTTPTFARWRACRKTRHLAPTDAKQRHRATNSAKKPQKKIAGAKKRQSASIGVFFVAASRHEFARLADQRLSRLEQLFEGQNR
jgi:hypothetical protein